MLEVETDAMLATVEHAAAGPGAHPVDLQDIGPEVGEHHPREGSGAEAGQLEHADAGERPHGVAPYRERRSGHIMAVRPKGVWHVSRVHRGAGAAPSRPA